ncbi:MAG: hypothetical protein R6U66_14685 [Bacteroidales bacterium]
MKRLIQILLAIAIVVLGYFIYESIQRPIRFNQEKKKRYDATIQRMKDIRKAQLAFKKENGKFTGSFDSLITFIQEGQMSVVRAIGSIPDSLLESGWTEEIAIKEGLIVRDTMLIPIKDTLFSPDYPVTKMWRVPFSQDDSIQLGARVVLTGSKVKVPVFEAKVHNNVLLHGLDEQLRINLNERMKNADNFPGVKVGDLEEPNNNAGNWE